MPNTAANELHPRFLQNVANLATTSPALHELVQGLLAINSADRRIFVSTLAHAHLYAGRDYLLRLEFPAGGNLQLCRDTKKTIYADANTQRAEEFFRSVYHLVITHNGYQNKWAELDRVKGVLTLKGGVASAFITALVALVRSAAVTGEGEAADAGEAVEG